MVCEQEAELRHKERLEALRRANSLLNEQTDLMKNFRSAQLYSEVLHVRLTATPLTSRDYSAHHLDIPPHVETYHAFVPYFQLLMSNVCILVDVQARTRQAEERKKREHVEKERDSVRNRSRT
jgi:hypothetical protein